MKAIYISDELHRRVKLCAAEAGISLKDLIETWVQQSLSAIPAHTPGQLNEVGESMTIYELQARPVAPGATESHDEAFIDEMERRGLLTRGERLREQFQAEYLALRKILGITTPQPAEPPSIEEVRASFRRQRELHPEAPTVTEILIQMREEE
jgi:hypothetical protein